MKSRRKRSRLRNTPLDIKWYLCEDFVSGEGSRAFGLFWRVFGALIMVAGLTLSMARNLEPWFPEAAEEPSTEILGVTLLMGLCLVMIGAILAGGHERIGVSEQDKTLRFSKGVFFVRRGKSLALDRIAGLNVLQARHGFLSVQLLLTDGSRVGLTRTRTERARKLVGLLTARLQVPVSYEERKPHVR